MYGSSYYSHQTEAEKFFKAIRVYYFSFGFHRP